MDVNVATPVAAAPAPAGEHQTPEDAALDVIVSVGKPSTGSVATPEPAAPAPAATPTPTPTDPPAGQTPAEPIAGTPPTDGAQTPTDPAGVASGEAPAEGTPALDEAKAFEEALGLSPETEETVETWRGRAEDAARETSRVSQEREAQLAALREIGVELVHVGDGQYQLAPTDDYRSKFDIDKDVDIARLIEPMSEAQRDAMFSDPEGTFAKLSKGVAKKVALELLAKRPPIKEALSRPLLTESETREAYGTFVNAKMPDGKTSMYPDADKPEIQSRMSRLWTDNSPAMNAVREAAVKDKGVYMAAMELCYYKAAYGVTQVKERIRLAGANAAAQELVNQNDVTIPAGGAGAPAGASPTAAPVSAEDDQLNLIANAKPV